MSIKNGQAQFPCLDMFPAPQMGKAFQSIPTSAIFLKSAIWKPGQEGKITITFAQKGAAWSHIGSESNNHSPSMNLGFCDPPYEDFKMDGIRFPAEKFASAMRNWCGDKCDPRWKPGATVLHEFGHALGMLHEHQSGFDNPLKFNKEEVYKYYQRLGMTRQQAETNVIDRYECTKENCPYEGSDFDIDSIMLYSLPDEWVIGKNPTRPNFVYAKVDKEWLGKMYPPTESNPPRIRIQFLDGEDWEKYWTKKMVQEELAPYVGIQWIWDLPNQSITHPPRPVKMLASPQQTPPSDPGPMRMAFPNLAPLESFGGIDWRPGEGPQTKWWGLTRELGYPRIQGNLPQYDYGLRGWKRDQLWGLWNDIGK